MAREQVWRTLQAWARSLIEDNRVDWRMWS